MRSQDQNVDQQNPKAILFDLDNTLIDREATFVRAAEAFWNEHDIVSAAGTQEETVKLLVEWDADGYSPRQQMLENWMRMWPGVYESVSLLSIWYRSRMDSSVIPDHRVTSFLKALNNAGIPWGIVTNGSTNQHGKVKSAGFEPITPFMIISEEFGHQKPDPPIYEEALLRLGRMPAQRTLFVGDNPETDIKGAQKIGMLTAWLRRGRVYPTDVSLPDYQIDHVAELRPMFVAK